MTILTAPSRIAYDISFWLIVTIFFTLRFYFLRIVQPKHQRKTAAAGGGAGGGGIGNFSPATTTGHCNAVRKRYATFAVLAGDCAISLSYILISADLAGDVYLQAMKIHYGGWDGRRRGSQDGEEEGGEEWVAGLEIPRVLMDYNLKYWFATPFMWMTAMWCIKLAFLSLYYDIGTRQQLSKTIRRLVYAGVGITLVTWPIVIITYALWCGASSEGISRNWKITTDNTFCHASISSTFSAIKTSMHILTDTIIFTLPILILRRASATQHRVSDRHLYGIIFIFCLGFSTIIVSIVRYIETVKVQAAGTDMTEVGIPESVEMIWLMVVVEYAVAMMAVCLPSMRSLLRVKKQERSSRRLEMVEGERRKGSAAEAASQRRESGQRGSVGTLKSAGESDRFRTVVEMDGWTLRDGEGGSERDSRDAGKDGGHRPGNDEEKADVAASRVKDIEAWGWENGTRSIGNNSAGTSTMNSSFRSIDLEKQTSGREG